MDNKYKLFLFLGIILLVIIVNGCSQKIDTTSCQDDNNYNCLIKMGINEGNPNYCEKLKENTSFCYELIAVRNWDYGLCDKAEDQDDARICKITISHDSKDMETCLKYSFEDDIENLLMGKPTKQLCEVVINKKTPLFKEGIFVRMNIKYDPKECEAYDNDPNINNEETLKQIKESCYYEVAINTKNLDLCEKVKGVRYYYCLARVMGKIKN